ncbi:YkvA family protein [Blastopirellula marina]|uniref:DUF1232 domain-containing protein n=1 Tax=Blastopirellula marina TaxID=124 RepID=A0A2S8F6Z4_9BACT|nr:DUF1232 domain-containing protein [Blastopirellula marina]PQO27714.1 hypothetical protein C5Y98_26815 [Blastopirellula marina]PTL41453.1 DUF1232 domain-containing protein [Blastopirellula marina]
MNAEAYERLNEYAQRASEADVEAIREKIRGMNRGPIRKLWNDVMALWRMITDKNASWVSRSLALGAIVYLITPIDGVPDLLPLIGLSDDAAVIIAAVAALAWELNKYRQAEANHDPMTVDAASSAH